MSADGTLAALQSLRWTSHNLELAPGVCTRPGEPLLRDEVRTRTVFRELRRFLPGPVAGRRALDLGCLEGGFTVELARAGFDALGVEGRASNVAICRALATHLAWPNLRFEHRDVKALEPAVHGRFDAVLCLGLLYHLDDPAGFLALLGRLTTGHAVLFLDTHVAPADDAAWAACSMHAALSPLVRHDASGLALEGRWFHEYDGPDDAAPDVAWMSVSNARSFWPTEPALIRALVAAGFARVFPLYGCFPIDDEFALRRQHSRAWYVAVKD